MNRHQRIVKAVESDTINCIQYCMDRPAEVEVCGTVIGIMNGIDAHDDSHLPYTWSAFYVVHNDACRVWTKGMSITPKEGDVFAMNIHRRHGVVARRRTNQVFAAIHVDATSKREAMADLRRLLKDLAA